MFSHTRDIGKEKGLNMSDKQPKVIEWCVSLGVGCLCVVNLFKIVQVFYYRQKRRKTVRKRNPGPGFDTALYRDPVCEVGTDRPDDKRSIIVEFAKKRRSADSVDGYPVDGVLLKVGEKIADRPGKKAGGQDAFIDEVGIPKPPDFGSYGNFGTKIPKGETIGGKIKT